jgi:hypothetical protein
VVHPVLFGMLGGLDDVVADHNPPERRKGTTVICLRPRGLGTAPSPVVLLDQPAAWTPGR